MCDILNRYALPFDLYTFGTVSGLFKCQKSIKMIFVLSFSFFILLLEKQNLRKRKREWLAVERQKMDKLFHAIT